VAQVSIHYVNTRHVQHIVVQLPHNYQPTALTAVHRIAAGSSNVSFGIPEASMNRRRTWIVMEQSMGQRTPQ